MSQTKPIRFTDVIDFINSDRCYMGDLNTIIRTVNDAKRRMMAKAAVSWKVGQRVRFNSTSGQVITGHVTKVNRMTVHMKDALGNRWLVSPTMLEDATLRSQLPHDHEELHRQAQNMPKDRQVFNPSEPLDANAKQTEELFCDLAALDPSKI